VLNRGVLLAAPVACAALISPALASGPTMSASPNPVQRGHVLRLYGSIPGCPAGDQVTLISKAFSHRHDFAGVPAVFGHVGAHHAYSVRTTIPAARKPGRYSVTGRCGGGNLGVSVTLRVQSSNPLNGRVKRVEPGSSTWSARRSR
jgi:hypothetical protein